MLKKLVKILLIIPVIYLVAMPAWYAYNYYTRPCNKIQVTIIDSAEFHFVTKRDIQNTILKENGNIIGKPRREIRIDEIEQTMRKYRELRKSEVYMDINGTLHIYADQRTPVMRLMPGEGGDYFIDNEGVVVRRRNLYTPRLHIVGGNINITRAMLDGISVLDTVIKNTILKDIYYLVNYINDDDFWSAQIDQIYVDGNDEIDLIPRVGNHTVHLGNADNYEEKLKNLQVFYEKVLPEVGWNKYSVINLAYRDQIICRRR